MALPLFLFLPSCNHPAFHKESRALLGTVITVEIAGATPAVLDGVFAEAAALEKKFSVYLPESEVSLLNRRAGSEAVAVSDEMWEILSRSREVSRMTRGAFDITVGPLMRAWGFFPKREGRVPSPEEIAEARARVGWEKVILDPSARTVRFSQPGVEIDLGGVAPGYVVDRMIAVLRARGIKSAMVNAGGEIYCLGERPGGGKWRIGVEHPRREGDLLGVLELEDRAVSTSGDYRNYFIRSQKRYSHIMDPRTGRPALTGVVESTAAAPDCLTADALATALFVLGAEEGMEVIREQPELGGIVVTQKGEEFSVTASPGLEIVKP
ncbi:MAG: FAD:protein FMN transferase [Candidatus Aureabacteria bacterium]|nr:FAD:protein FMN transferase [Candidatus Auribacterota bacterium]